MKSVFNYSNYLKYLKDYVYGAHSFRGLQAQLAKAMGCQAAYFSQVLRGTAELTEDHGLKLVVHLGFNELESEYFILLVRLARASTPELSRYLESTRQRLVQQSEDLESKVGSKSLSDLDKAETLAKYFTNWMPSTLHIATSSENYQTPKKIAERFRLPLNLVTEQLEFLHQAGLVIKKDEAYVFSGESLHLPKSSSLDEIHQTNRRMQALKALQEANGEDLHFSSVFTLDKKAFKELKQMMAQFIADSHQTIHAAGTEEVYSLCLDLFRVV